MTILVTAASGHLGRRVLDALLDRGAAPAEIVAGARDTSKLADVASRGIRVVELDYARPRPSRPPSARRLGAAHLRHRVRQPCRPAPQRDRGREGGGRGEARLHERPKAMTSELVLMPEHRGTEEVIAEVGVPA
ncbi:hypothetical protein [Agromyces flavus]|uniref:hypothetical protein n=1 Tax=Agromyces flavus TaxID=589382 RepID=UPI002F9114A3